MSAGRLQTLLLALAAAKSTGLLTSSLQPRLQQLHHHTRRAEVRPVLSALDEADPTAPAPAPPAPIDPRKAVEELGALVEQVKEVWSPEAKQWSLEERASRRRQIVTTYVAVFAPAVSFSGVQLSLSLGGFLIFLLGLKITGRGYADIVSLASVLPPLQGLLDKVDDSWGDAAIALLLIELSAPVLLAAALALTPTATEKLQAKLVEWDLDADGLNARIEKVCARRPTRIAFPLSRNACVHRCLRTRRTSVPCAVRSISLMNTCPQQGRGTTLHHHHKLVHHAPRQR